MLKQVRIIAIVLLTFFAAHAQATQSAQDYFRSASAHFRANEFVEALADYNKVIELEPTNADALFYRIVSLNQLDPLTEPISDWDRIIELAPRYKLIYVIYFQRANYRARIGKFDESIEDVNKALEFTPNDGAAYHLRSYSYLMKGNLEAAHADYKKSIELKTTLQNPLLTRGYVFKMRREFERAVADYTMALAWKSNDAIAYVDRGTAYVLMGKIDLGLEDIKRGMNIDRISIVERAVEGFGCPFCALNIYVAQHPQDARVYEARGILRLLQRQESDAKIEFDRSISLAPGLKPEIERIIREVRTWH
jgi:tetratricopeptide (TPR) repeat protein